MSVVRAIATAVVLFGSCVAAAQPASHDPYAPGKAVVADIDRIVTPNGVDETFEVTLGGARQVVNVRGADRNNPILLFVHGGPGAVEMPIAWAFQRPWEDFFTVVQWDQRGAGKSYRLEDPQSIAATMTFERYRDDAIELIEKLRQRYGKRKIVLLGHSWGSAIGLGVALKRPDLLYAYVGMGQVIDWRGNERAGLNWTLAEARRRGDTDAVRSIEALKPYPDSGPFTIDKADAWRKWAVQYGSLAAYRPNASFYLDATQLSPLYDPADLKAWSKGSSLTVKSLWPRLADLSFRNSNRVNVPVIMLIGRHDHTTDAHMAFAWMQRLRAPKKKTIWLENSAHLPMIEEPGKTLQALLTDVLPLTK